MLAVSAFPRTPATQTNILYAIAPSLARALLSLGVHVLARALTLYWTSAMRQLRLRQRSAARVLHLGTRTVLPSRGHAQRTCATAQKDKADRLSDRPAPPQGPPGSAAEAAPGPPVIECETTCSAEADFQLQQSKSEATLDVYKAGGVAAALAIIAASLNTDWVAGHATSSLIAVFVIGYAGIIVEEELAFNKAGVALVMAVSLCVPAPCVICALCCVCPPVSKRPVPPS